ncbi:uncharacterized protein A1O5_09087 [Cladophialophora psammophila CBS 110553]|uniref:Uncharacterized protein n=1 Tax=Cladophialophora psammophila CBS 110553 TaxID=1182543 RepID=W9WSV5_9EURO|nr:uncharacterized protein A1O5_09087 [Cladophialophora psammophila CBS 110553]EXJ67741.1 hypothetical protein A1O5_09087 [Cladophialophora psammophila CBS 110553]
MSSRRRKSSHYHRCESCPNRVAGIAIFQQLVQRNTDQGAQIGNLQAHNATLQTEWLARGEQLKGVEKVNAGLQTEIEKLRPALAAEKGKTLEVDTKLETIIQALTDGNAQLLHRCGQLETENAQLKEALEGDKVRLKSQREALEANKGQPKDQNEVLEEDRAQLRGHNRALEGVDARLKARISELEKAPNESGEELLKTQRECNRLQETARNGGTTELAIHFGNITPPTTPRKTPWPTMPGHFPVDDNPQPDEQVIPQESAKKDVRSSSPTPQMETASQK